MMYAALLEALTEKHSVCWSISVYFPACVSLLYLFLWEKCFSLQFDFWYNRNTNWVILTMMRERLLPGVHRKLT